MKVCTEVTDKEELNAGEGVRSGKRVYLRINLISDVCGKVGQVV